MQKGDREGDLPSFRPPKLFNNAGRSDGDISPAPHNERLVGDLGIHLFPREPTIARKFTYSKEMLLDLSSRCLDPPPSMAEGLPQGFYCPQALTPLCAPGPPPALRNVSNMVTVLIKVLQI